MFCGIVMGVALMAMVMPFAKASANESLMELLPMAMQLLSNQSSSAAAPPEDYTDMLKDMGMGAVTETRTPESKPVTRAPSTPTIDPEAVVLADDPDMQKQQLQQAIESVIAINLKDYQQIASEEIDSCQRGSDTSSCSLKAYKSATQPMADVLIDWAEKWSQSVSESHRARYWDVANEVILHSIQTLLKDHGQSRVPHVEQYVRNKIRLKKLFGL